MTGCDGPPEREKLGGDEKSKYDLQKQPEHGYLLQRPKVSSDCDRLARVETRHGAGVDSVDDSGYDSFLAVPFDSSTYQCDQDATGVSMTVTGTWPTLRRATTSPHPRGLTG